MKLQPRTPCGRGTWRSPAHHGGPCSAADRRRAGGRVWDLGPGRQVPLSPGAELEFYSQFSEEPLEGLMLRKDTLFRAGPELPHLSNSCVWGVPVAQHRIVVVVFQLRQNSYNIKLTISNHFKVSSSLAFSTFTALYNHHLCHILEHCSHPEGNLVPVKAWALGFMGFPGGSDGKASACSAGDPGSIPGSGRSPGEGNGNPLQYSCLENSMD